MRNYLWLGACFAVVLGLFTPCTQAGVITHTVGFDGFQNGDSLDGVDVGGGYYYKRLVGDIQSVRAIGGPNGNVAVDSDTSNAFGATQVLYRLDGRVFSVLSFEIADLSGNSAGGGGTGGVGGSGYRIGFTGRGDIAYSPETANFVKIDVSANPVFKRITSIGTNIVSSAPFDDFALDNIELSYDVVPEPSTLVVWSIAIGVSALKTRRRLVAKR